jgi:membrane protease YdiL (CAAX protease family)
MIPEAHLGRDWRIGDAVLAVVAGFLLSGLVQVALGPEVSSSEIFRYVVPMQVLATIGVVAGLAWWSAERRSTLGLAVEGSDWSGLAIGAGLQVALSLVLAVVIEVFLGGDAPTQEVVQAVDEAFGAVDRTLVVIFAGLLAPLSEELVFRGALLRALLRDHGRAWAVYGSSGAFAAIHLLDPQAILVVPVLFVVGIVLARQRLATGRLAKPILTHAGFNLLSVLALFVAEGGEAALG